MKLRATFTSLIVLLLLSCEDKKDTKPEPLPDPDAPAYIFTRLKNANATLQATYLSWPADSGFIGTITFIQGLADATFESTLGVPIKPAEVRAEGERLIESQYVYRNKPGRDQGIDFGNDIIWQASAVSNMPAINEQLNYKVPEIGELTVDDSLNTAEILSLGIDLNHPFTNIGDVDSVNFFLFGKAAKLSYRTASTNSVEISSEEINSLGKGKAYLMVEAFRFETRTYQGYKVGYVNKGAFYKPVYIY